MKQISLKEAVLREVKRAPNGMPIDRNGNYSERGEKKLELETMKNHIEKKISQGWKLVKKGRYPNGTLYHIMKPPKGSTVEYLTFGDRVKNG